MTFELKIRILVLRLSFFDFHIFFSIEKAWLALDILRLTSGSESPSACILDPRYIKSLTASIAPSRVVKIIFNRLNPHSGTSTQQ